MLGGQFGPLGTSQKGATFRAMAPRLARYALPAGLLAGAFVLLSPDVAQAKIPQSQAASPPADLQPGPTKTVHEVGATVNFTLGTFDPQFNWRMAFPKTGAQGQLSGLFLGVDVGPSIGFGGGVAGMAGFRIGYEFDPWSNLALTFSPVAHFDNYFGQGFYTFTNTFGAIMRLYIKQHWVVQFEIPALGYGISTAGNGRVGAGFHLRAGWGFAYKF